MIILLVISLLSNALLLTLCIALIQTVIIQNKLIEEGSKIAESILESR